MAAKHEPLGQSRSDTAKVMRYGYRTSGAISLWVIIAACLLVYLATFIASDLFRSLGLVPAEVPRRPWTLLTTMFVHAGFGHILFNMLSLYFFGTMLIELVGEKRFLMVYFLGGLLGSIFFVLLGPRFTIVVGASGAIFALGGALVVMRPQTRVFIFPVPVPLPLWVSVLGSFLILSFVPGVAWQAHLGGLILGLIAGYLFRKRERKLFLWRR
ncbi:MAG: rhomboid family intramembrane serine protease [Chloroflexi bacterium]|nr:rhomboid family intramembrane serine protease [Chloroflexota bacterium]